MQWKNRVEPSASVRDTHRFGNQEYEGSGSVTSHNA